MEVSAVHASTSSARTEILATRRTVHPELVEGWSSLFYPHVKWMPIAQIQRAASDAALDLTMDTDRAEVSVLSSADDTTRLRCHAG